MGRIALAACLAIFVGSDVFPAIEPPYPPQTAPQLFYGHSVYYDVKRSYDCE